MDYTYYTIPIADSDYVQKIGQHADWYGVGILKLSGKSSYLRLYSSSYRTYSYRPHLFIDYRVPYQLKVDIKNKDPVLDTSNIHVSPDFVEEGDIVSVSGITYTDSGTCDSHDYRVVVDIGEGQEPMIVKDWSPASGGLLDFEFEAPDDDPEDADSDISSELVNLRIELRDDDYTPNFHYQKITLELNHYEYYQYSWYKDWGVYQNLEPWEEGKVTWANYPRSNSKSTPEDTVAAHGDHVYKPGYGYHWDGWNITSLAKRWIDGSDENYGLRIQPVDFTRDTNRLYSSDTSTSSRRPILRITPVESTIPEIVIQPDGSHGKDAMLRNSPYINSNYGTHSYLVYTRDSSTSSYRYETNGLIEFDFSYFPKETDETGIARTSFDLTINNVAPEIDLGSYQIRLIDDTEVTSVSEGQEFMVTNVKFNDPAAEYVSETFSYRVDWGDGVYSPWSDADVVMPYCDLVVPNEHANTDGGSSNVVPWRPSFGRHRYQQWYRTDHLSDSEKEIVKIGFRPNSANIRYAWTTTYFNMHVYLSHTTSTILSSSFENNYGTDRTLVFVGSLTWDHKAYDRNWLTIPLQKSFHYDGTSNLVLEISYAFGSESGSSPAIIDADYSSSMHRLYGYDQSSPTGSLGFYYGLVTNFIYKEDFEAYGLIPNIRFKYPDDHPVSGTAYDEMTITIEIRDDDTGLCSGTISLTVTNVAPIIEPGQIWVNGKPLPGNILLVNDAYYLYQIDDWVNAIEECNQRPEVKSSSGLTVSEMKKYDMVIWLRGGEAVRYLSIADRSLITNYINTGGKIVLQGTYWYNTYYWAPLFYLQFGIRSPTYSYYLGTSGSRTIAGTGGDVGGYDEYTIRGGHREIYGYYRYMTRAGLNGGTPEFLLKNYPSSYRYTMVHRDNPGTGSIAMMMGFDLNQINSASDQEALMKSILDYFDIGSMIEVEIDEGDEIQLRNFDVIDPAEGVSTEIISFNVDWGDGEIGSLSDISNLDGINMIPDPQPGGPGPVVPNAYATSEGNYGNYYPWGSYRQHYQQLYDSSQLGGKKNIFSEICFRPDGSGVPYSWETSYTNLKVYLSHINATTLSSNIPLVTGNGLVYRLLQNSIIMEYPIS
jgi:hypothetical protein